MRLLSGLIATIAALLLAAPAPAPARPVPRAPDGDQRLVLVTLDGTRWREVFGGPDAALVADKRFTDPDLQEAVTRAWATGPDHGAALAPFLHGAAAQGGVLFGNRDGGQCMEVRNGLWFSYPGYNEMLTGRADDARITSNDKLANPNVTFLEWLNRRAGFAGRVAAVGTWDVFPYILNAGRSGIAVNAAFAGRYPTDTLTMRAAFAILRTSRPRVLYVGLGDTDELAHIGDYDQYLAAINRDDDFIGELWRTLQADPAYRGRTTLIVTTDHGRGTSGGAAWTEHGSARAVALDPGGFTLPDKAGFPGSEQIWFAAFGPGVHGAKLAAGTCLYQNQIAASALAALGQDWRAFDAGAGAPMPFFAQGR